MENYECLGTIGEGTYGVVMKCRHKVTGQIVAIKKFKESDEDEQVKKTALREIKILKQLKHENVVNLLEVFRVEGKLYLVFEFVEKTILEEIEKYPEGLDPEQMKRLMWQIVRVVHFLHSNNIIHRDIKPENLLVSRNGVLKICDFGFARPLASAGAKYTEYVSTRWYRAPELLVGDVSYGKAVDVWSIGCMFAEIATGLPLFPGDSDIDQLYQIIRCIGRITPRHQEIFRKNTLYVGVKLPHVTELEPLETRFVSMDKQWIDFMIQTIKDEPLDRWTCGELLEHPLFQDKALYEEELQQAIAKDLEEATQIKKKRNRKLAPGVGPGPGPGFGPTSPTILAAKNGHGQSTPLVRSCESIDYSTPVIVPVVPMSIHEINTGLKKSFKPLGGGLGGGRGGHTSVTKEKMTTKISSKGFSTNTSSLTNGSTLTPLGVVGGFHLPTIQAAANSVLTTLEPLVLTDSIPIHQAKKHHPMPIHEEMGCAPSPFGGATSSQEAFRISMTSHGSRASQPSRHLIPSPFQSNAHYAIASSSSPAMITSTPKQSGGSKARKSNKNKTSNYKSTNISTLIHSSLQDSVEIYSHSPHHKKPMPLGGGGGGRAVGGGGGGHHPASIAPLHPYSPANTNLHIQKLNELTPDGIYVPPRTSHANANTNGVRGGYPSPQKARGGGI